MPTDYNDYSNCIMYVEGKPIGHLHSMIMNTCNVDNIPEITGTESILINREFSFTCENVTWFPDILDKHQHYMTHGKSIRVRNKHRKIYDKLFQMNWYKLIGI